MAIQKENLRLGNFYEHEKFGYCRLVGFHKDSAWIIVNFGDEYKIELSSLKEIELNSSWLLAFGFELVANSPDFDKASNIFRVKTIEFGTPPLDLDEEEEYSIDRYEYVYSYYGRSLCFFVRILPQYRSERVLNFSIADTHNRDYTPYLGSINKVSDLQNFFFTTVGVHLKIESPNILMN